MKLQFFNECVFKGLPEDFVQLEHIKVLCLFSLLQVTLSAFAVSNKGRTCYFKIVLIIFFPPGIYLHLMYFDR